MSFFCFCTGRWMMSSSPSNSESEAKRICDMKTIGTHSGHFHCDEALACYMLKLLPEYKDARYMYIHIHVLIHVHVHVCTIIMSVAPSPIQR